MASPGGVLASVAERPRELLEDLDVRDRAQELTGDLQKRSRRLSKDLRKQRKRATKRTRQLTGDARDLAEDLRDRIGDPRDRAEELRDLAVGSAEVTRERVEGLEPVLRRIAVHLLTAFQAILSALLLVPRLIVRLLGVLGGLAERAEIARERGHELSERARDVAHQLPPSRRMRWKRRGVTVLLVGSGFAIGFVVGWLVAQRSMDEAGLYDEPVGLQPVGEPLRSVEPAVHTPADTDDGGEPDRAPGDGERPEGERPESGTGA